MKQPINFTIRNLQWYVLDQVYMYGNHILAQCTMSDELSKCRVYNMQYQVRRDTTHCRRARKMECTGKSDRYSVACCMRIYRVHISTAAHRARLIKEIPCGYADTFFFSKNAGFASARLNISHCQRDTAYSGAVGKFRLFGFVFY